MPSSWALTPPYFLAFGFLCGVVGFRVGWRIGNRLALPVAEGAFGWLAFLMAWEILGATWAASAVGAWAVGTTLASVYTFLGKPADADRRVIRAAEYRASMLDWLATGRGPETKALETARGHLREGLWYTAAAVLTANFASIIGGAVLLNYMNAYVATLLRAGKRKRIVLLMAWNLWSILRVAAYVAIGAAAASPLLRIAGLRPGGAGVERLAWAGAAGVLADLVVKLTLSRSWGGALASAVDLAAARENRSAEPLLSIHID